MDTLIPLREDGLFYPSSVDGLPEFDEAMQSLVETVLAEAQIDSVGEFVNLKMDENGNFLFEDNKYFYNRHSLAQAVYRIKPDDVVGLAGYLAKCPPTLRFINYDYWHGEKYKNGTKVKGNNIMLRTMLVPNAGAMGSPEARMIRAVVSQIYTPIDDPVILDKLGAVVPSGAKLSLQRGDRTSRYGLYWPTEKTEVGPGDDVMLSLKVFNSETGTGSVHLHPMVYSVALNGWFAIPHAAREVSIRHVGEAEVRLKAGFAKVRGFVDPFVARLKAAYRDDFTDLFKDVDTMFKALGRALDLTDVQVSAVKNEYTNNKVFSSHPSRYHVAGAIAATSTKYDLEGADKLHEAAGNLIVRGWEHVVKFVKEEEEVTTKTEEI